LRKNIAQITRKIIICLNTSKNHNNMKIISVVGARPGMMAPQQPRMGVPAGKTTHTHQTTNPFGKISVVIAAEPDLREGAND
jgi:hypothetical protein